MSKIRILFGIFLFVFVFSFFDIISHAAYDHSGSVSISSHSYSSDIEEIYSNVISYPDPDPSTLYEVKISFRYDVTFSESVYLRNLFMRYGNSTFSSSRNGLNTTGSSLSHFVYGDRTLYLKGSDLNNKDILIVYRVSRSTSVTLDFNSSFVFNVISVKPLDTDSAAAYTEGYNFGYNQGYSDGQNSGYSDGFSDGYSQGEESGYNSGFSAGVDSVDTQSYYDAGYAAGESAGYADGYDSGYQDGYDAAYERFNGWGADTSVYPKLFMEFSPTPFSDSLTFDDAYVDRQASIFDSGYYASSVPISDHVYRLNGFIDNFNYPRNSASFSQYDVYVDFGGMTYFVDSYPRIGQSDVDLYVDVYVPGYFLSRMFNVFVVFRNSHSNSDGVSILTFTHDGFDGTITDCGPVDGSQNETAKQTDDLTHGYNNSAGSAANNSIASDLGSYSAAEHSLFTASKDILGSFEFVDPTSISAVASSMTFINSVLMMIYNSFGGSGGIGIFISVSFCVLFASLVIGIYRYYKSRDGG